MRQFDLVKRHAIISLIISPFKNDILNCGIILRLSKKGFLPYINLLFYDNYHSNVMVEELNQNVSVGRLSDYSNPYT